MAKPTKPLTSNAERQRRFRERKAAERAGLPAPVTPDVTSPAPAVTSPKAVVAGMAQQQVQAQLTRVQQARQACYAGGGQAIDIARYEKIELSLVSKLAELSGELRPADESRLAQSARFRRFSARITDALRPYPDALKAVVAVLESEDRGA